MTTTSATPEKWEIREFQDGYIECAAWASTDEWEGETVELDRFDYSRDCEEALRLEALQFVHKHYDLLTQASEACSWVRLGHDLWLTRNGHGAGYWDRELGSLGEKLTEAAHAEGERTLYLGDDKLIYVA